MKISRFHFLHNLLKTCCALFLGTAAWVFVAPSAFAADDAYLKELEAEANNSAQFKKKPVTELAPKNGMQENQAIAPSQKNMQIRTEFEQTLANERPATYSFYEKLPESDKANVLDTYKESKKISTTSKKIFDLYFALTKK